MIELWLHSKIIIISIFVLEISGISTIVLSKWDSRPIFMKRIGILTCILGLVALFIIIIFKFP
jgi:hypothetical protein